MINVIKASAGSGKTFTLAKTYIEILLDKYFDKEGGSRKGYQSILAVTFTNKATAEMKERIIGDLAILAKRPEDSPYSDDFARKYGSLEKVRSACSQLLQSLLHDYSRFSVSTIDTFFQSVLRSFARELGQFNAYKIELDRDGVISETVDSILAEIVSEEDAVAKALEVISSGQVEDSKKSDPVSTLRSYASTIMSGEFTKALKNAGLDPETAFTQEKIDSLINKAKDRVKSIREEIQKQAGALKIECDGFAAAEPKLAFRVHFTRTVDALCDGEIEKFESKCWPIFRECDDFAKPAPETEAFKETIRPYISAIYALLCEYKTLTAIRKSLPNLVLVTRISEAFAEVTKGKNIMCLDESTKLLSDLIDGTEAPFIYEKMGVRYDSFLLDEFQDTSLIQWENFGPLLQESKATGGDILVVGDTKQSIYRFRDSDWSILEEKVPEKLEVTPAPLLSNWRSGSTIVEFNNDLFTSLPSRLDSIISDVTGKEEHIVSEIYPAESVKQEVKLPWKGVVDASFVKKEEVIDQTVETISMLHEKGIPYCRMLVLLRGKEDCSDIAEKLVSNNIAVYSEESLQIESDPLARRLSAVLHYMDNPTDHASKYLMDKYSIEPPTSYTSLVDLCEQIILELRNAFPDEFTKSIPYLDAFVDIVKNYEANYGNSLHSMLAVYDRSKKLIASSPSRDAVQIMTIHKSKGLAGYFVIVPFLDKILFYKSDSKWSSLDADTTLDKEFMSAIYSEELSSGSIHSSFSDAYKEEYTQSIVDNVNLLYVALTRAKFGLYLIGNVAESFIKGGSPSNMACMVYNHVAGSAEFSDNHYEKGSLDEAVEAALASDMKDRQKEQSGMGTIIPLAYPVSEPRGKVRFSGEALDFFRSDEVSLKNGSRVKGIVLHNILSRVRVREDLEKSILEECENGLLDSPEQTLETLSKALDSVESYKWFAPGNSVINERDIISPDGAVFRPDRIVIKPDGSVDVVDYKFGHERESDYALQVKGYCELLSQMGYKSVQGYIWYVTGDKVSIV